jgi:hypothetical protein
MKMYFNPPTEGSLGVSEFDGGLPPNTPLNFFLKSMITWSNSGGV